MEAPSGQLTAAQLAAKHGIHQTMGQVDLCCAILVGRIGLVRTGPCGSGIRQSKNAARLPIFSIRRAY
jgi:hypothetical protein